jgi:hypothetical protein
MKNNEKKLEAVLSLPGPKRYSHFIIVAADQRRVWGLFLNGWALAGTDEAGEAFPLWPAEEFAMRCAVGEWAEHSPRDIDLETLFEVLIPKLKESGTSIAVFPTPLQEGVMPDFSLLENDLRDELSRIE